MDMLEFERVTIAEARQVIDGARRPVDAPASGPLKGDDDPGLLLGATVRWIAGLPEAVRPLALALKFPRIANSIGDIWSTVASCEEYLDALVVDQRGDTNVFPPDVAAELARLKAYYAELFPHWNTQLEMAERGK